MAISITIKTEFSDRGIRQSISSMEDFQKAVNRAGGGVAGYAQVVGKSMQAVGAKVSDTGASMTRNLTLPLAAVGAGLYKATQAAADDAAAQVRLATAMRNTAGATAAQIAATESWITTQGKVKGVADDELRPALQALVTATGDVGKAQALTSVAMDIAAAKGIPVSTAATALAKAYGGTTTALGRMLPGLDQGALKSKNFGAIMASVNSIVGGQAATAAATQAGQQKIANVQMQEAVETLGTAFLPIMQDVTNIISTQVVPAIQQVAEWFQSLSPSTQDAIIKFGLVVAVAGPLVSVFGKMMSLGGSLVNMFGWIAGKLTVKAAATAADAAATTGAATAQWGLNAALLANPITWVIAGIVALIAIGVLLWKNWDKVTAFLSAAWEKIKSAASTVWNAVVDAVKKAASFIWNLFVNWSLPGLIIKHWNQIKDGAAAAWNAVVNFFKGAVKRIIAFFEAGISFWLDIGKNIVSGIWNGLKNGWNMVVNGLRSLVTGVIDKVKGWFGIKSPSKVFAQIGDELANGLSKGVNDGKSKPVKAAADLCKDVVGGLATAYANERPRLDSVAKDVLDWGSKTAKDTADSVGKVADAASSKAKEKIDSLVASLKDSLKSAKEDYFSFRKDVMSAVTEGWDLGAAQTAAAENGTTIVDELNKQAEKAKTFSARVNQLIAMGLSQENIQQIIDAGVANGTAIADALIKGGQSAIEQANALYETVKKFAWQLGEAAATQFYQTGISNAKKMLEGITAEISKGGATYKKLMKKMDELAAAAARQIKLGVTAAGIAVTVSQAPAFATQGYIPPTSGPNNTSSSNIVIQPGAIVINGANDAASTQAAVEDAFAKLAQELRAR